MTSKCRTRCTTRALDKLDNSEGNNEPTINTKVSDSERITQLEELIQRLELENGNRRRR